MVEAVWSVFLSSWAEPPVIFVGKSTKPGMDNQDSDQHPDIQVIKGMHWFQAEGLRGLHKL